MSISFHMTAWARVRFLSFCLIYLDEPSSGMFASRIFVTCSRVSLTDVYPHLRPTSALICSKEHTRTYLHRCSPKPQYGCHSGKPTISPYCWMTSAGDGPAIK